MECWLWKEPVWSRHFSLLCSPSGGGKKENKKKKTSRVYCSKWWISTFYFNLFSLSLVVFVLCIWVNLYFQIFLFDFHFQFVRDCVYCKIWKFVLMTFSVILCIFNAWFFFMQYKVPWKTTSLEWAIMCKHDYIK